MERKREHTQHCVRGTFKTVGIRFSYTFQYLTNNNNFIISKFYGNNSNKVYNSLNFGKITR